jgi:hypothetical protein
LKQEWVIPPEQSAEFVWRMEDVLDVYCRPYDPRRPLVCLDEMNRQLLADTRQSRPAATGHPERVDCDYRREGTANLFMCCEPLGGWRHVEVTERRTRRDWAQVVKYLVDVRYPDAERIVLVLDNLNTHSPASLYETFVPAEAKRIVDRLEIHYTPKHGSWLNIAEIELSVLSRQCLGQRIPSRNAMAKAVAAWEADRNRSAGPVNWRFTTADARIRLKRLYPSQIV